MPDDSDIFEGDSNVEEKYDYALDLDLFAISNKYKEFWKYPERTDLYQAVFLMLSLGMPYEQYNPILNKIVQSIGTNFTLSTFNFRDKKLKEWGMSSEKISGIRKILEIAKESDGKITSNALCKVKEGGIRLVKMFKVLQEEDDDIFVSEDYVVRRMLTILYCRSKIMTIPEAKEISKAWQGHRSQISYFLSRLKDSGARKILDKHDLDKYDFVGYEKIEISKKDECK